MRVGVGVKVGVGGSTAGVEVGGANVGIGSIVSLLVQAVKDERPVIRSMSPINRFCFDLITSAPFKLDQRVVCVMLWPWSFA